MTTFIAGFIAGLVALPAGRWVYAHRADIAAKLQELRKR